MNTAAIPESVIKGLHRTAPHLGSDGIADALSEMTSPYFRAEWLGDGATPEPGFSVIIVTSEALTMTPRTAPAATFTAGKVVLIPHASGICQISGTGQAVRCRPPATKQSEFGVTAPPRIKVE